MRWIGYILLTSIFCLQTSCMMPYVIGHSVKVHKIEQRKEFMNQLHQANLQREKAGLPPLDVCTEKYYFDKGWAKEDPMCEARVFRYENGYTDALGQQQFYPIIEEVESEDIMPQF